MPVTERGRLDWLALPAPALLNPDVGLLLESGAGFIRHNFLKVIRRVVLRHNFHPLSSSFCPVQAVRPRHRANRNAFVNSPSGNVHSNTHSIPTSLFYFCSHLATTRHDFVTFPSRLCRRGSYGRDVSGKSQWRSGTSPCLARMRLARASLCATRYIFNLQFRRMRGDLFFVNFELRRDFWKKML